MDCMDGMDESLDGTRQRSIGENKSCSHPEAIGEGISAITLPVVISGTWSITVPCGSMIAVGPYEMRPSRSPVTSDEMIHRADSLALTLRIRLCRSFHSSAFSRRSMLLQGAASTEAPAAAAAAPLQGS